MAQRLRAGHRRARNHSNTTIWQRSSTMTTEYGFKFRLGACQRCGGDAYLDMTDEPEWRCLQCARLVTKMTTVRAPIAARLRAA